jgi:ATP-dependent nuclease, subunit B
VQELRRRLARLAGLDPMSGPLSAARARQWLGELLRAGFEPRSEHAQPILITSPEEAAELSCDLRLVVDADAAHLPTRREPTPFLDLATQRSAGVPEASAAGRLAAAQHLAARLGAGAQALELYCAEIDARGAQSRPTPLFEADEQTATDSTSHAERLAAAPAARAVADDPVPPVQADEQLRGTAGLLQSWFGAPFFAFCRYRLHIEPLPEIPHGLAPQIQGEVLHEALQTLWAELGDRAGLLALDAGARERLIDRVLDPLLRRALPEAETGRVLYELEHGRLHDLLRQWLAHEARRIDDFRVIAREQSLETALAGLPLRLRIDRIDCVQTPAGPRLLLIDYKTGANADPRGWAVDRLREPQLPLYAVVLPRMPVDGVEVPLGGITFGHLKDGHPALATANDWRESLIEDARAPRLDWLERSRAGPRRWKTRCGASSPARPD